MRNLQVLIELAASNWFQSRQRIGSSHTLRCAPLCDVKNLLTADCDMPYVYSRADEFGVKALLIEALGKA